MLPKGIITVLNTPFAHDGTVDLDSLDRNVIRAGRAGVAGFLVPALAAEVFELTREERTRIVERVVQSSRALETPLPVIGSATAITAEDRRWHARHLARLGCAAVLVAMDPKTPDDSLVDELKEMSSASSAPLIVQDWDPAGVGISPGVIDRIAREVPAVVGLKVEVVPSGPKFTAIRESTGDRYHLSGGWTVLQMIEAYDRGVDAFMPTGLHEVYTAIDRAYRRGNREGAKALFSRVAPILAFSNQHLETSIHFFKRLLQTEGTYATANCRIGNAFFDRFHEALAGELIACAIELINEAGAAGNGANVPYRFEDRPAGGSA